MGTQTPLRRLWKSSTEIRMEMVQQSLQKVALLHVNFSRSLIVDKLVSMFRFPFRFHTSVSLAAELRSGAQRTSMGNQVCNFTLKPKLLRAVGNVIRRLRHQCQLPRHEEIV